MKARRRKASGSASGQLLFVGAFPSVLPDAVAGGQLTLCATILASPVGERFDIITLDSTQRSVPPPKLFLRLILSCRRLIRFVLMVVRPEVDGVLVMGAGRASGVEKTAMILIAKLFGRRTGFYLVATDLFDDASRSRGWRWLARRIALNSDVLICQGPTVASKWCGEFGATPEQCYVVPNLVSLAAYSPVPRPERGRLKMLFAGWIMPTKGVFDLVEAVGASDTLRRQKLTLCGKGPSEGDLRRRIRELRLEDTVELAGWVAGSEIRDRLLDADIYVLPSHSEGFSIGLIEALAAGCAVVTTDVGLITDYVRNGEHGLIVPAREPASLREALERVVCDGQLRERLQEAGVGLARLRFDASVAYKPLESAISDLLGESIAGSELTGQPVGPSDGSATLRERFGSLRRLWLHGWGRTRL